jgi:hypothetical protein
MYVDAKLNVTLPSFNPMLLGLKLHEKNPKDYDVSYKDNSSLFLRTFGNKLTQQVWHGDRL